MLAPRPRGIRGDPRLGAVRPEFYGPENLWDCINGAAPLYLDYGFRALVAQFYEFDVSGIFGGASQLNALAFTDDGSSVIGMNEQGAMASWSTNAMGLEWEIGPSGDRLALKMLGDEGLIVTSSIDGTLRLSHLDEPGVATAELVGHAGVAPVMASAGELLASGSEEEGGRIRLWDLERLEPYGRPIPATDSDDATAMERRGRRWLIWSFVFCPCHLPISIAVLATIFGGTAVGALVSRNTIGVGVAFGVVYAIGVGIGLRHIRRADTIKACRTGACEI